MSNETNMLVEMVPAEAVARVRALVGADILAAATATRDYPEVKDWKSKEHPNGRTFAKGTFADHRDPAVQDLVLALFNTGTTCPVYSAAAGLQFPNLGRRALKAAQVRAAAAASAPVAEDVTAA